MPESFHPRFRAPEGWPPARYGEPELNILVEFHTPANPPTIEFVELMIEAKTMLYVRLNELTDWDIEHEGTFPFPTVHVTYSDERGGRHGFSTIIFSLDEVTACFS